MIAMPVVRLEHAGQLIIPNEVREILGWEEGDYLDIALKEEVVILKKTEMIPEAEEDDESWFLSDDWQERHHKSLKDIAEGRIYGPFENAEDLLKSLKS